MSGVGGESLVRGGWKGLEELSLETGRPVGNQCRISMTGSQVLESSGDGVCLSGRASQ